MKSKHNAYLNEVLQSLSQKKLPVGFLQTAENCRTEVMEVLRKQLDGRTLRAGGPVPSGSWKKNTEVNFKFDFDVIVPFRQGALAGDSIDKKLAEMRKVLQSVLEKHYAGNPNVKVRAQRFSVGVHFTKNGKVFEVDVVPGMEVTIGLYKEDNEESNKDLLLFNSIDRTKLRTNVHRQIRIIKAMEGWREIIRLLKAWNKQKNSGSLSSYAIEILVKMASETQGCKAANSLADRLEATLEFLATYLAQTDCQLTDIGSGNQWKDFMKDQARIDLANRFKNMLKDLRGERGDEKIKEHFPILVQ